MGNRFLEFKNKFGTIKTEYFMIFSYFLSIMIAGIVYISGGTTSVYPNLMYIPISFIATTNGKKHALINATFSAFLLGPFMPLNVELNIMQTSIYWMVRMFMYVIVALVIGYFADYYRQEFEKNSNTQEEAIEAQLATIFALVKLAESRDNYTGIHIERVAKLCKLIAQNLGNESTYEEYINEEYIENIYKASPLHDIGKVGIPDKILLKPNTLSPEEFEIMKTHTTIGATTLKELQRKYPNNKFLDIGIDITHYHHERWDGTGYPTGLSGEDIPLSARIMAIADVYDALRSERVYKEAYSHDKSIEIIKQGEGTHFDPIAVKCFLENVENIGEYEMDTRKWGL